MPRWIAGLFTDNIVNFTRKIEYAGADVHVRPWQGRPFSAVVAVVCADCNNGWMSRLESAVAPTLTRLIRNESVRLDLAAQHALATWAFKTMLMLRFVGGDSDDGELGTDSYSYLRLHGAPPPGEQVWAASYAGEGQWPMSFHYYAASVAPPGASPPMAPNAHCASFAVGHAAFGLAGNRLPEQPVAEQAQPPDTHRSLWPAVGPDVDLPPPATFAGDAELQRFSVPEEWHAR